MISRAAAKAIRSGTAFFATTVADNFVIAAATKRFIPTGGVTKPIARLTTIRTPKWTGSMPAIVTTGKNIGVIIKIEAPVSISIPITSKMALMTTSSSILFATRPPKVSATS